MQAQESRPLSKNNGGASQVRFGHAPSTPEHQQGSRQSVRDSLQVQRIKTPARMFMVDTVNTALFSSFGGPSII